MKKKIFIPFILLLYTLNLKAQDCSWYPADCPDEASIENSQSSSVRTENGLLPKEIAMQDNMRSLVTQMILKAASDCEELKEKLLFARIVTQQITAFFIFTFK
jgi:hypothetical protein